MSNSSAPHTNHNDTTTTLVTGWAPVPPQSTVSSSESSTQPKDLSPGPVATVDQPDTNGTSNTGGSNGCIHLARAKHTLLLRYRVFVKFSLFQKHHHKFIKQFKHNQEQHPPPKPARLAKLEVKRDTVLAKIRALRCTECRAPLGTLLACLHCDFRGCWKQGHIQKHYQTHESHVLAMELHTQAIYCGVCQDYVYSHTSEDILREEEFRMYQRLCQLYEPQTKRLVASQFPNLNEAVDGVKTCEGIRGLRNMGSTCFMNVILQAFVHNPLLRSHFLSDSHNRENCTRSACIACEMDQLFRQVFSGDRVPWGPSSFLQSIWQASTELAGYSQQDAHEFFITALNHIHAGLSIRDEPALECPCIIHQTFAGQLQSTVTCLSCGHIAVAYDPMLDISLDLRSSALASHKAHPCGDSSGQTNLSLIDCLKWFTGLENLGAQEYRCSRCGDGCKEATKRLQVKLLPPVLSFQLKRFEHSKGSSKIESFVRIPSELDMTPFTIQGRHNAAPLGVNSACQYHLFAVINHEGSLETGHYTMYALHRQQWLRFDDHLVTVATLAEVLDSNAYMCFYIKKFMDYSPN